ncbi:hypothetical protein ACTQ9L_14865 [Deinococcus wulumuqiensis]
MLFTCEPLLTRVVFGAVGSGLGSVPNRELVRAIGEMLEAAAAHGWTTPLDIRPLAEVEAAWNAEGSDRLVLVN